MVRWAMMGVVLSVGLGACWKPFGPPHPPASKLALPVTSYRLENGLRVVVLADPNAAETQVTMRYEVGSLDDPPGRAGMAHLVEHLKFQQVVDGESVFAQLERTGSWFNGTTELDTTTYVARGAPSELDHLLALEASRFTLGCETIAEAAFEREREVVRNELRQNSAPLETEAAIVSGLFASPHEPRETVDTTGAITLAEACAFADQHYAPAGAVLVVSGNVTRPAAEASIKRLLGPVARRTVAARRPVGGAPAGHQVTQRVPLDSTALIYGWRLPDDPGERARARALAWLLEEHVSVEIEGSVVVREYGGDRAPMIALAALPASDESVAKTRATIERLIRELPTSFDNNAYYDYTFDHARQVAVYRLFATFEDGGGREVHLADHMLAGRDPGLAVQREVDSLASMEREGATRLARRVFALDQASVVTLEPATTQKTGQAPRLEPAIHDAGQTRVIDDPAQAQRAARRLALTSPLVRSITRTLPDGAKVILLPLSSVPTVEVRYVFAAGSGDDPSYEHGTALVTAHALAPKRDDLREVLEFYDAGGSFDRTVGLDHTVFEAHGLGSHLDELMVGLERLVRGGHLDNLPNVVERLRVAAKTPDPGTNIHAAWRSAIYGADHVYTASGLLPRTNLAALDASAVATFRTLHYRPEALTIIIAGGFDPAIANQWINYLFSNWEGSEKATARQGRPAHLTAASLAAQADTTLVQVDMALPAVGSRSALLVLTELIDQVIGDVRHQLGASYGLNASLDESRLAVEIRISGSIDASRTAEALALVRDRLAALATDPATASRFVSARRRVMGRLLATYTGATALADHAESSVALGRSVGADVETAEAVRVLTLADFAVALRAADLARAAILLCGPTEPVMRAFEALGRVPEQIAR